MPLFSQRPQSDQERATRPHGIITKPASALPASTPHDVVQAHVQSLADTRQHLERIAKTIAELNRGPRVLETRTLTIPAQSQLPVGELDDGAPGVWTGDRYRIPFAAIAVENTGTSAVIVTTGPPQSSAPGGGQGQVIVPATSYAAWNMAGSVVTIYGTPGTQLSLTVFADSVMPFACDLGQTPILGPSGASLTNNGKQTGPTANLTIAQIAANQLAFGVQYQVTVSVYLNGTTASPADDDNFKVNVNGGPDVVIPIDGTAASIGRVVQVTVITPPVNGTNPITVSSVNAGTSTAIYHATITATPLAAS